MADVLTKRQRRLNMSRVRGRDTQPELILRGGLHRRGIRYRLHRKDLPGRPDLVFPASKGVIFVHGCFWHRHNCPKFNWPKTRQEFWRAKIESNQKRDKSVREKLNNAGWRVQVVWECALLGASRRSIEDVLDLCEAFIKGEDDAFNEVAGIWRPPDGAPP
ncbi:MAG: very short patch repair endonuclease [Rhodobacteraceae bacterium]|nr:very short patch repair endonuclease [Paracoccaceae bacterium]